MTRINTNVDALRGLRNVQKANQQLQTSLQRLSTGVKISSGRDNPSGLIASESLRLQTTTIEQSIKNSNRANNVISTADSALGEIGGLLNQVRGLVQEGLNTGALSSEEIAANQAQIDAALSAINRISSNTSFAGDKLLDGSKAFVTSQTAADAAKLSDFQISEALFGTSSSISIDAQVTSVAQKAELRYSGGSLTSATTLQVAGTRGSQVLFLGANSTVANVRDAVNGVSDVTGVQASVISAAPGSLTVANATAGSLFSGNTTAGSVTLTTAGTINISRGAKAATAFLDNVNTGGGNAGQLTITDTRTNPTTGLSVTFTAAANTANASVTGITTNANGDQTITIALKTDANGDSETTLSDLNTALSAYASADALIDFTETGVTGYGSATGTRYYGAAGTTALSGGQTTANNDLTFTDARPINDRGTYNVAVSFIAAAAGQTAGVAVATNVFGDRTINVTLATDANTGAVTTTAAQVAALIAGDSNASALVTASASGDGSGIVQAAAPASLSDVTNSHITFTDGRATDTNAVFTNALNVVFANAGANQTLGASFSANGDGGTLTVNLATDANGVVTTSANDIKSLIENNANNAIKNNFKPVVAGNGTGIVSTFSSTALTGGANGANNDLTFTDKRATNSVGEFATSTSVQFVNSGANQALAAAVSSDANGNKTITINLATDANGAITSTAGSVATFLSTSNTAGAVEARGLVNVAASGDGTGLLKAKGPAALTGGANGANNDVTFTDVRTGTQTKSINVAFNAPGSANQTLGVTVGLDGNGNHLITVNLATDANSIVTTTAAQVANFINTDSSSGAVAARALVSAAASGTGADVVTGRTAAALTASSGSDVLVLRSTEFGSKQFVEAKALAGSFATTLADGTTASDRDTGADIGVRINGQTALGDGLKASVKTSILDASLSFKEANNAVGQTASISVTGGGATFQIGQEVSAAGQIGIGIEAVNTARLGGISGKLYELGSGNGKTLLDVKSGTASASSLVDIIDQAVNRVSTLRGRLGALQKNVIETNISTLGVALENISEARSQIIDTDFAEETAAMQKAQVLNQAGISVLSIANQNPQQVLSLLR
jgi:flagellin